MINCYTRSIKYITKVKSLTSILVKDFFTTVNLKSAAKSVISASLSNIFIKNSKNPIALFATCLLMLVGAESVSGATKTWVPTAGGLWTTAGNWSPSGVPSATGDDVIISSDLTGSITAVPAISLKSLTINGNCSFDAATAGNTITITGAAFVVASGKTFNLGVANTFNFVISATGSGVIAGTVNLVSGGTTRTFTNSGDLTIAATGLIDDVGATGTKSCFALSSGATLRIGSTAGITTTGTTGNVQVAGTRTYNVGANYVYNSTANQTTGNGLPTNLTGSLTIDNSGNTVTLSSAEAVANGGTVNLISGIFANGTNLTLNTATSTINRSEGSMTGAIQGAGANRYNVNYTGTSKTSGTELSGAGLNNVILNLTSGQTLTLDQNRVPDGNVTVNTGSTLDLNTYTFNRSAAGGILTVAGTLMLGGTSGGQTGSNFPTNFSTLTMNGGTVSYDNANGGQTVYSAPGYNVLTMGNTSGIQTAGGNLTATTLNNNTNTADILNMGTNTLTVITPNNSGTIRTQNTSGTPISGGETWGGTVTFDAAGGQTIPMSTFNNLTLAGSGTKTIGSITINNGGTLISNNLALTFVGDFINNGVDLNAGSSPITIGGVATQSIDGFITTGLVSMTKTGGIATLQGNVNGAGLTINGSGGTLNLGSGLTHTFNGTWTRTNGTLNGGSSLLRLGGALSGVGGAFTANAGTVEWYAAGAQTIAAVAYNNLVLSNSGAKSISAGTSIVANLSISGATASVAAGQNISVGSLTLGGFNKTSGTWGSTTASIATNKDNTYFAATTGYVTVTNDTRPIPTFSGITASQSICFGTPTVTLSGTVSAGSVYPANGETVGVTINGVLQSTTIAGGAGGFSINFTSTTIPVGSPYTITYSYAGGTNLTAAVNNTSTTLTVSNAKTPTTTGSLICVGSVTTLTASGAIAGDKYLWYDAASGGTLLKPSTDNNDNIYTTAVLVATTNYWVSIMNAGGCEGPRTQVTATFPSVCTDPLTPGTDSWVGYVYGGRDSNFANNIYYGHYTEPETFNESFGGDATCFNITSNSISRSIYTQNLSVKYLMNSTKKGLYVVDLGSDDGNRLTVDGTLLYNDWGDHALNSHPGVLMSLKGTSSLMYEYYENGGGNTVYFQNLTQVLANNLTTNTTQTILLGNAGAIISGDAFGTLPTGVSLSGTGYQWTYSTTPGGGRTDITGATGPTLTPSNAIAPFNTAGTYYVYRNAILSSANNVAPNPYVATNESNVATITIAAPGISTSVSSLTGFSYVVGSGPSAEQSLNVVGIGLIGNITVTPPADFEVSVLSGGVFQTTPLTLTAVGGVVNTTVYVRMKQGLTVGGYNSENIVLSAAGFTSKDVACSGIVIPGVTAGGGGSYCAGGTINLTSSPSPTNITLTNVYWTGPNSFYSTDPNPSIPTATTAMSGTYTVTGNYVPAINLLVNGDFEKGTNLGITTNYQYVAPSSTALSTGGTHGATGGEGNYTVVGNPKDVHSNFSNCSPNGNYQMVVNGSKQDLETVWGQTVTNLDPNTNYQFTYSVQSVTTDNPSMLQLYVNGSKAGGVYTANAATCVAKQFVYNWNSGASTTAVLTLVNRQTQVGGNDFALDDIVFQPVYTSSASVNVSVLAAAAPASVSIAASPGSSVNSGTSVTFTATPTSGGVDPDYQWQVDGVNKGTNSPTYTYIPTDGNTVTCTMTSKSKCLVGLPTVTSNTITMAVNNPPNYWKGAYSTDWGNAANWTAGYIPGIGDNIIFSTVSTSGDAANDLKLDDNRIVGNLTNLSSKKLIIPPAKCLTANGTITTDGNANKIYIQAWPDGTQQNGSLIFHNDVSSPVYASVEMYSKATRDLSGVKDPNTGIIYYYSWQYFGIPLRSVVADPTFYGSFVRRNDEASTNNLGKWFPLTNSDVLTSFTGYEITQDAPTTFVFQGALENGDKSIALPYTSGAYDPGQSILANPYTAAIDVRQLVFGPNTEKTVYLYNTGSFGQWADKNGETTNDTTTITPGQYIAIPQRVAASIGLPNDIPSMSGFLVKATNTGGGSLNISYNSVITKNVNPQRAPKLVQASDQVYLQITLKGKNYGDRVWLVDEPGTSHGFDNGWDGYKLFGAVGTPKLFAMENDANYQISTADDMNNTYLGFQAGVDLEDTLTFRSANIAARYSAVYLVDLIENKVIDITKPGAQYTFKAAATTAPIKRFKVVTQPVDENPANSAPQLKVFNDNNIVFVNNPTDQKGELYFYDIMGRYLKKEPFGPNGISAFPLFSATGAYIVKTVTSTEQVSKKIIIK